MPRRLFTLLLMAVLPLTGAACCGPMGCGVFPWETGYDPLGVFYPGLLGPGLFGQSGYGYGSPYGYPGVVGGSPCPDGACGTPGGFGTPQGFGPGTVVPYGSDPSGFAVPPAGAAPGADFGTQGGPTLAPPPGSTSYIAPGGYQAVSQKLLAEKTAVERRAYKLEQQLSVARDRIKNLADERGQLQSRYVSLLRDYKNSPLSAEAIRSFEALARKYPNFEFDPVTGISKFNADILFASGSDGLRRDAVPLLRDFARIMNTGPAKNLNILVVGHTDDEPITSPNTAEHHPTNWHLSTNRANAVAVALAKAGLPESRMGVAGYNQFQPAVTNTGDGDRQRNRRVEIYVLAPQAVVAGAWEGRKRFQ
ncbi:MAG: OmpA family protein [Planctomycetota bacterium]